MASHRSTISCCHRILSLQGTCLRNGTNAAQTQTIQEAKIDNTLKSQLHSILDIPWDNNQRPNVYSKKIMPNDDEPIKQHPKNSEKYLKERLSESFQKWCQRHKISLYDGLMLYRIEENSVAGRHPDFPRRHPLYLDEANDGKNISEIFDNEQGNNSFDYYTKYYWTSIDTQCFRWIQKQRILYRNNRINPWIQWKLEQFNVTLDWYVCVCMFVESECQKATKKRKQSLL